MIVSLCSAKHLSAIVKWAATYNVTTVLNDKFLPVSGNEAKIVQCLRDANRAAFIEQYERQCETIGESQPNSPILTALECLKAIRFFTYQAENWSEWAGSDAQAFIAKTTIYVMTALPGYAEAPWGIK